MFPEAQLRAQLDPLGEIVRFRGNLYRESFRENPSPGKVWPNRNMASHPTKIGKYNVEGILGRGGMGVVYKAVDSQIGRYVAIKMITSGGDPSLLERFKSEARSTGSLQCPNIVTVYDFGEQDGNPYLVMQFLEGSSLDSMIQKGVALTLSERLGIIIDVCNGLAYAHQRGVIHRDIKPGNIMVLQDGVNDGMAVIVDFGIARIGGDTRLTRTDQIVGSVHYMSSEQLQAKELDSRTDVYATGVVLFQLLTGALPFDSPDTAATLLKIVNEPPPPLSTYIKEYPPELDGIVSRALAKKREERYPNAKELAFDLMQVQEHLKSETVAQLFQRVEVSLRKEEWTRAREHLQQVLRLDRQNTQAQKLMSSVQERLRQLQQIEQARGLRSQADEAYLDQRYDDALRLLEQAVALDGNNSDLVAFRDSVRSAKERATGLRRALRRAEAALQDGDLDEAQNAVGDAFKIDPQDTQAKALKAIIAQQAEEKLRQEQVRRLLDQARNQIAARNLTAAFTILKNAEVLDPTSNELQTVVRLAMAAREQEKRRAETEALRQQIEAALREEDYATAVARAEEGLRKFPQEQSLLKLKALADAQRLRVEQKKFVREQFSAANSLADAGQLRQAVALLERALQRAPGNSELESLQASFSDRLATEEAGQRRQQAMETTLAEGKRILQERGAGDATQFLSDRAAEYSDSQPFRELYDSVRERGALDALDSRLASEPSPARQVQLAEETLRHNPSNRWIQQRVAGLRQLRDQINAVIERAQGFEAAGRFPEATQQWQQLSKSYPQVPEFAAQVRRIASLQEESRKSRIVPPVPPPPIDPAVVPNRLVNDDVQFTVYRPSVVTPARWHTLLAFAHLSERRPGALPGEPDPIQEVHRQAQRELGDDFSKYSTIVQDSGQPIPAEGALTFVPEIEGVEFNPSQVTFLWQENVHRELFRFRASAVLDGRVARGHFTVFLGSIIVAQLTLNIRVDSHAATTATDFTTAPRFRKIFASYSHKDAHIVDQFSCYVRAFGDEYLRDVISLRPGEEWNEGLRKLIDAADVFQLFWSSNSMRSDCVKEEWGHALSLGRQNFIVPVYWEEPLPASRTENLPPEELGKLHFYKVPAAVESRKQEQSAGSLSATLVLDSAVLPGVEPPRAETISEPARPPVLPQPKKIQPAPERIAPPRKPTPPPDWTNLFAGPRKYLALASAIIVVIVVGYLIFGGGKKTVTVRIDTNPAGANVTVDTQKCTAPCELSLPPGTHGLRIEKDGYETVSKQVPIAADTKSLPIIELVQTPPPQPPKPTEQGTLIVRSNVDDAEVFVDGDQKGVIKHNKYEGKFDVGSHQIILRKSKYKDSPPQSIEIAKGQQEIKIPPLEIGESEVGYIVITTNAGATIAVDGKVVEGRVPREGRRTQPVTPGTHSIQIQLDGYDPYNGQADVKLGENFPIHASLKPKPPTPQPQAPPPTIVFFTPTPSSVQQGQSVQLNWKTENANALTIDPIGSVAGSSKEVSPTKTTTYTLIARGPGGTARSESVTVTVNAPPPPPPPSAKASIVQFGAGPESIQSGGSATLFWSTQNANVSIDPNIGPVEENGNRSVSPSQTTTYTLTARGPGGDVTKRAVTVTVKPPEQPLNQSSGTKCVERFKDAYESLVIDELQKVWPSLDSKSRNALKDSFKGAQAIKLEEQQCVETPSGSADTAQYRCRETMTYTINGKRQPPTKPNTIEFTCKKTSAGAWIVASRTVK